MSVRSIIAVLGGIVILSFLWQLLEVPLVNAFAPEPLTTLDEYLAARNRPAMHAAMLGIAAVTGVLAGYMVAKIAGRDELPHAAMAAGLETLLLLRGFAAQDGSAALPYGVRTALVLVTIGAMLLGAAVRGRAAAAGASEEVKP